MLPRGQQNDQNTINRHFQSKNGFRLITNQTFQLPLFQKLTQQLHPLSRGSKFNRPRHRTQESSPIYQKEVKGFKHKLPELIIDDNIQQKQLRTSQQYAPRQPCGSKTTHILDSLIRLLKDDTQSTVSNNKERRKVFTEEIEEFRQDVQKRPSKKPKIVKNQVTRMMFQEVGKGRRLLSEERSRKPNLQIMQKMDYTFYGGSSRVPLQLQNDCLIESKEQLNKLRVFKLHPKQL